MKPKIFRVSGTYENNKPENRWHPNFSVLVEAATAMQAGQLVEDTIPVKRIDMIKHEGQSLSQFADSIRTT